MASRRRKGSGAHGEHRGSWHCLPSVRRRIVHHGMAPPGRRRARGTSRQSVLPVTATTAGRTSWRRRVAGTAAAHGEHCGSRYCLSSLRQRVVHHGIAPPGRRQHIESIDSEAVGSACHCYDCVSYFMASHLRDGQVQGEHRGSRYCLQSLRQRVEHRGIAPPGRRRARRTSRQWVLPGSCIVASRRWAGGAHEEHRVSLPCLPSLRQLVMRHCIAQPGRRRARRASRQSVLPVLTTTVGSASLHRVAGTAARTESIRAVGTVCHRDDSGSYIMASRRREGGAHGEHWRRAWKALRQLVLPATTTTAGRTPAGHRADERTESIEAGGTACHRYDSGLYIMASRRRDGCAHGEHRGSRYCL